MLALIGTLVLGPLEATPPASEAPAEPVPVVSEASAAPAWEAPVSEAAAPAATAESAFAPSEPPPLVLSVSGWWRARGTYVHNLFLGQSDYTDIGRASDVPSAGRLRALQQTGFLEHGLRLSPKGSLGERLTLQLDLDLLEGVVWGDNDALASTAVFAGSPSDTGRFGEALESLKVRRAWAELTLPVGLVKIGRQPSHWGMGLLANKGDGLELDFGDYHYGSTVDRILFATKPLSIVRTLAGAEDTSSNLTLALAYDKLVDDDLTIADPDPERACTACAPQILLARPGDDVDEWVGVLLYKDEEARLVSARDLVQAGVYVVYRAQRTTRSQAWVIDGHAKVRLGPLGAETEVLAILGESSALAGENPKRLRIVGGVGRAGWYARAFEVELEAGYAPGDDDPLDPDFTGYPLHPDYNVGLLLYEEVLAARTARTWTVDGRGLWSRGGVYNSFYLQPKVRWRPLPRLTALVALLWARADHNDGALWAMAREPEGGELDLGYEVDVVLRYDFLHYAHLKLESGVLLPGIALWKDTNADLRIGERDRAEVAYTVQARLGVVW